MKLNFPMYEATFSTHLSLHDSYIKTSELAKNGNQVLSLALQVSKNCPDSDVCACYEYKLQFIDYIGVSPQFLIGKEIFRAEFIEFESSIVVAFMLLPDGESVAFTCSDVEEVSLESCIQCP